MMSRVTDEMIDAAFEVFKGDMLMREEDRDLLERMLRAALAAQDEPLKETVS